MDIKQIAPGFAASPQMQPEDVARAAAAGYRTLICNRPDGEAGDQPDSQAIAAAAKEAGLAFHYVPVVPGQLNSETRAAFRNTMATAKGPVLAYCRTGTRSTTLWALTEAPRLSPDAILGAAGGAGYDLSGLRGQLQAMYDGEVAEAPVLRHEIVIVGAGAAGVAAAASILKRNSRADIAIVEPREIHYYQPGFTLVGAGVFDVAVTRRRTEELIPNGAKWIRAGVSTFQPDSSQITLEDGSRLHYGQLIVAPGLMLDWAAIKGLPETLGKNGVTSNYHPDTAAYTWELVRELKGGKAIFTQPPMPIKCAGAPQKAMYLSADAWSRHNRLKDIDIEFCNAGAVLFGVADYVPALMDYIKKYDTTLSFSHNLIAVDGARKIATFRVTEGDKTTEVEKPFDMLHVTPPQRGLDFVRNSPLVNAEGWVDVDQQSLRHVKYDNVWSLGDASSTPNAKTAAAVRKQAPVLAVNLLAAMKGQPLVAAYDGYGSCPLTVEKGRIVLAEFGYGGKLLPSFPNWLIDGKKPSRLAWFLKERMMPPIYWMGMFKGREYLAKPTLTFKKVGDKS